MLKTAFVVMLSSFFLVSCGKAPRLPQGALVKGENVEIQTQLDRLGEGGVATITVGNEHSTFEVLRDFMSTDNIQGVGGGDLCKAYKLTTKDGTEEVGFVCKKTPFGKAWKHRPWREWFYSLGRGSFFFGSASVGPLLLHPKITGHFVSFRSVISSDILSFKYLNGFWQSVKGFVLLRNIHALSHLSAD